MRKLNFETIATVRERERERESYNSKREEKAIANGITLIALIITILVLIILASVSITMILGNEGIIGRVKQAKEYYETTVTEEQVELSKLNNTINLISNRADNVEELKKEISRLQSELDNIKSGLITIDGEKVYFDNKNGKYGYNTDSKLGEETFTPLYRVKIYWVGNSREEIKNNTASSSATIDLSEIPNFRELDLESNIIIGNKYVWSIPNTTIPNGRLAPSATYNKQTGELKIENIYSQFTISSSQYQRMGYTDLAIMVIY